MKLSNGIEIEVTKIANIDLFSAISEKNLVVPKVPQFEEEEGSGIWQDNPLHPLYHDAIAVYEVLKSEAILDIVFERCVTIDRKYLGSQGWERLYKYLKNQKSFPISDNEMFNFVKFYAFKDATDRGLLARNALLTESLVYSTFNSIGVVRNSSNIHEVQLKNSINTHINVLPVFIGGEQLVNPVDEYRACSDSGLNWGEWITCNYTMEQKASTIALHRLDRIITIHNEDAVQIEQERKSKSKSK